MTLNNPQSVAILFAALSETQTPVEACLWIPLGCCFITAPFFGKDTNPFLRVAVAARLVGGAILGHFAALVFVICAVQAVVFGRGSESGRFKPRVLLPKRDRHSFVVLTAGSRGDVQPFIALALELQRRKHGCVICSMLKYKSLVESHGIQFESCGVEDIRNDDPVWRNATHVSEVSVGHGYRYMCSMCVICKVCA